IMNVHALVMQNPDESAGWIKLEVVKTRFFNLQNWLRITCPQVPDSNPSARGYRQQPAGPEAGYCRFAECRDVGDHRIVSEPADGASALVVGACVPFKVFAQID